MSPMDSSDPSDRSLFRWKCHFLFVRYLKNLPMLVNLTGGRESSSDGIYRIHWRLLYSVGNIDFLFLCYVEKFYSCWPNF